MLGGFKGNREEDELNLSNRYIQNLRQITDKQLFGIYASPVYLPVLLLNPVDKPIYVVVQPSH